MHRAMSAFATAALMAVALSACGSDESKGGDFDHSSSSTSTSTSTSTSEQPTEAPTTTTTTTITTTKAPGSSGKPSSSSDLSAPSSASQDTSNGEDGGATAIKNVWVDDSWTVEEKSDDVCAQGGLYTSQYTPCMDEDGDPMPITFRSRPGEPGYHYLFTSPKLLRESVPDAPEHGRDRGADIFPLMAQSGCGIAFNPGTPTYLNLTPEMLQEMAGAK